MSAQEFLDLYKQMESLLNEKYGECTAYSYAGKLLAMLTPWDIIGKE